MRDVFECMRGNGFVSDTTSMKKSLAEDLVFFVRFISREKYEENHTKLVITP